MTITLNSVSGTLLVSISFSSFPGVFVLILIWKIFCLLIWSMTLFLVDQLYCTVLEEWSYVECVLCGLCVCFCCGWAVTVEVMLLGGASPQLVCLDCCGHTGGLGCPWLGWL